MPVDPPGLVFINKDARSKELTHSSGVEKAMIFSHVKRIALRERSTIGQETRQAFHEPSARQSAGKRSHRKAQKSHQSKGHDLEHNGTAQSEKAKREMAQTGPTLPKSIGLSGDPFDSYAIGVVAQTDWLFGIYSGEIAPLLFPAAKVAIPCQGYTEFLAISDPLMRYALLSLVSTRMDSHAGTQRHQLQATSFKELALASLRHQLSTVQGDRVKISHCYAISMLLWTECLTGSYSDLQAHAAGLQYLIPRTVDTSTIPVYLLRIIYACVYLCDAYLDASPTLQPLQISEESNLSPEAKAVLDGISKVGFTGAGHLFLLPTNFEIIGTPLMLIAMEYQKLIVLRVMLAAPGSGLNYETDGRYVCLKEIQIEYDLLELPSVVSLHPLQDAVRLAMFIFSALPLVAATGSSAAFSRKLANQIRQNIERAESSSYCSHCSSLILWVLVVGAFVSRETSDWPWFQSRISGLFDSLGLQSMLDVQFMLEGYYYAPYLESTVALLWDEHNSRKAFHRFSELVDEAST